MVKHNNEIPHQHFKKDWQGYVIISFYAAFIVRVFENARRIAFIFSLFSLYAREPRSLTNFHLFSYYRNCSQSFVRTWFNQAGRKKSRRIGTFAWLLFEWARRVWSVRVHFRPSTFSLQSEKQSPFAIFTSSFAEMTLDSVGLCSFRWRLSYSHFAPLLNSTREESKSYLPAPSLWCFETGGPMPDAKIQL